MCEAKVFCYYKVTIGCPYSQEQSSAVSFNSSNLGCNQIIECILDKNREHMMNIPKMPIWSRENRNFE